MNAVASINLNCITCQELLEPNAQFCSGCGTAASATAIPDFSGFSCSSCGGQGEQLPVAKVYCAECRWLRPLTPGYDLDVSAFMYQLDAQAMNVLQSLGPLTVAARALSERVGRPWFEAATNGIRLSEKQLPDVFAVAIKAARIVGLQELPEIYVSGEQMWDSLTLGSDQKAFIVVGSVLTYFKGDELLFLLAREMGHVRAGHALWKTASKFLTGSTHMNRSIMGSGLLEALNPAKLLGNAIDAPLMAWARHSEITADRAGALAVGNDEVIRKVLLSWSLKSFPLYQRINQDEWLEQELASDDQVSRISEMTMSTLPFIARRMKQLRDYASSEECQAWREYLAPLTHEPEIGPKASTAKLPTADTVRLSCTRCNEPMRVPRSAVQGKALVRANCPNSKCGAVLNLRWREPSAAKPDPSQLRFNCAKCNAAMLVPQAALTGKSLVKVRCPAPQCGCVLDVRPKRATPAKPPDPLGSEP